MIKKFTRGIIALMIMANGLTAAALVPSETANAACQSRFLTFPAWYDGLTNADCSLKTPQGNANQIGDFVWRIVLNITNLALQIVAYASAGFIIYGGFKYLTSSGTPDRTAAAQKIIQNAVIGLVLSFFSVVIVTFVSRGLG